MSVSFTVSRAWDVLWPDYEKLDEEFRVELRTRGLLALRIVSTLSVAMTVLVVLIFGPLEETDHQRGAVRFAEEFAGILIGVAGWLVSLTAWGKHRSRGLAVIVGLLIGAVATVDMVTSGGHTSAAFAALVMVVLLAVAVFPLRPLSILGYGLAIAVMFAMTALLDPSTVWPAPIEWLERLFILLVISFVAAGLTVVLTQQHIREHESRNVLAESLDALRRTQANLIASKRAASQGRLAAALSHEINNPLSVLLSSQEVMERYLEQASQRCASGEGLAETVASAREIAARSREAMERIEALVDRFERFTQLDAAERHTINVNELLDDTVEILSGGWGGAIKVTKDYGEVPEVLAYPAGLSEVFSNVLGNAAKAIDGEGEIRIATRFGQGFVWVQIADSGRGIESDRMSSIFDPAFRNEGGRVRTGWGLFISRQIVHDHDGEFQIRSDTEKGTEVEICIPAGPGTAGI